MGFVFDLTLASSAVPKMLFITKQPTKTSYTAGEVFNPAGMEVSITYTNGMVKQVTDYTYSPTTPLDDTVTEITVSYTEKGRTVTATVPILVETTFVSIAVTKPPNKTVYNYGETFNSAGMEVTATFSNGSTQLVSGWTVDTTTLTTVGTQTITVSYTSDGVTKTATLNVTVNNVKLALPSQSGALTYNGSSQSPTWNNYNTTQLTIGGTTSGINATSYTATFTPKYGYCWEDNSTSAKNAVWVIGKASISVVPSQSGTLTYTGSSQSPTWNNYNTTQLTIGGTTSATNVGSYTATFTPTSNYKWADGSSSKSVTWTIGGAIISVVPSQSGQLTYTGSSQSPTWSNYNSSQLTLGGTTSSTNAGTYTATFTPKGNYTWSDGTKTAKSVTWIIGKATPTITLPSSPLTVKATQTISVSTNSGGTVSVSSSDTSVVNVLKTSNTSINLIPVSNGSATVTVSVAATSNYNAGSKSISVTVSIVKALEDYTWKEIQNISKSGQAANYFAIGDTKTITLNGSWGHPTINPIKFSNYSIKAFIIGINHNSSLEKEEVTGRNTIIHFQIGLSPDETKQIALSDTNTYYGYNGAAMTRVLANYREGGSDNPTNAQGWIGSSLYGMVTSRYFSTVNGTANGLREVLPDDLTTILCSTIKYTDNKNARAGQSTPYPGLGTVYGWANGLSLLSEYEMFGTIAYANPSESMFQGQYDYYANGNAKQIYRHNATSTMADHWLRSPSYSQQSETDYCIAYGRGSYSSRSALYVCSVSPIFFV